jgi:hypothetical protein
MFGFVAYFRGRRIFAGLPKSKSMHSSSSIIFKFHKLSGMLMTALRRDSRVAISELGGVGWQSFELSSDADLRDALAWLDRAYRAAA